MVEMALVQKICRESDDDCHDCPFNADHLTGKNSTCMFYNIPANWNIEEIENAFDDTHIIEEFNKSVMSKLLKIMRGNKDEK